MDLFDIHNSQYLSQSDAFIRSSFISTMMATNIFPLKLAMVSAKAPILVFFASYICLQNEMKQRTKSFVLEIRSEREYFIKLKDTLFLNDGGKILP